jgi:hypothetical protein
MLLLLLVHLCALQTVRVQLCLHHHHIAGSTQVTLCLVSVEASSSSNTVDSDMLQFTCGAIVLAFPRCRSGLHVSDVS